MRPGKGLMWLKNKGIPECLKNSHVNQNFNMTHCFFISSRLDGHFH